MCTKVVTGLFSHTCTLGGFLKDYAQPSEPAGSFSHAARVVEKSASVPYQGLVLTIDYGLQTSNGTGVPGKEHCLCPFGHRSSRPDSVPVRKAMVPRKSFKERRGSALHGTEAALGVKKSVLVALG